MEKNIAIILAGGIGSRMGLSYPKQFAKIAGKTAFAHTLGIFQKHPNIHQILIVTEKSSKDKIEEIINLEKADKVSKIVIGGKERSDSTLNAICALSNEDGNSKVLFHDAVRPLLSHKIIDNCLLTLDNYNAVDVVVPATDTIVKVNTTLNELSEIPNRKELYQGQTPQGFKLWAIRKAYEIYQQGGIEATCDCSVFMKTMPNEPIAAVEGAYSNIKLTSPLDLAIADKLFQSKSNFEFKEQTTFHENKVMVVFGGTSGIGKKLIEFAEKLGIKCFAFSSRTGVDISDKHSVSNALQHVFKQTNRIDFIVNSAAILHKSEIIALEYEDVIKSVQVNYSGAINIAIESYPYLAKTNGCLLNFASSSYSRGRRDYALYSSSKAAVVNLTQALSDEWENIKVHCINPERCATPMRVKAFGQEPEHTLLNPKTAAIAALLALFSSQSGNIIDVTRSDEEKLNRIWLNWIS